MVGKPCGHAPPATATCWNRSTSRCVLIVPPTSYCECLHSAQSQHTANRVASPGTKPSRASTGDGSSVAGAHDDFDLVPVDIELALTNNVRVADTQQKTRLACTFVDA
jgi:hypothetical protein